MVNVKKNKNHSKSTRVNNSALFEIHDTTINVREIMGEIESRLKKISIDKNEIERISKLSFNPPSPSGYREFDALGTANLFENGVSIPKFTNPSFWFVRGPLKWLIVKIVSVFSLIDKKLSENRIRAFYNLIHELILLKNRTNKINEKLNFLYNDFSEMMARFKTGIYPDYLSFENFYDREYEVEKARVFIKNIDKAKKILIIGPGWGWILSHLLEGEIKFKAITDSEFKYNFIKREITSEIELIKSILNYNDYNKFQLIILYTNLAYLSGWYINTLIQGIFKKSNKGTEIYLLFNNFPETGNFPFESTGITKINEDKFLYYLKEIGFKNIRFIKYNTETLVKFYKQ